jgi:hypothetical protein
MFVKKMTPNLMTKILNFLKSLNFWRFILPICFVYLSSCAKENVVPSYIHIPAFKTEVSSGQGSANQKISDVWVYVNGEINGVFPLPAIVPILELDKTEITLFAGIRNNGTRSNPVIYPFMNQISISKTLVANKLDTILPTLTYLARTKFWMVEDFENNHSFTVNLDNNNAVSFNVVPNGFEGKCIEANIDKSNPRIEKASRINAQLTNNAENIYLEMHYKTEALLTVGIIGSSTTTPNGVVIYKISLKPNQEWNKIYINLTNEAKELRMTDYKIVFLGELPDNVTKAKIQIDNVKLLEK